MRDVLRADVRTAPLRLPAPPCALTRGDPLHLDLIHVYFITE